MNVKKTGIVPKAHNHKYFFIEEYKLFESYQTIRGERYRFLIEVPDMPEWVDKCTDAMVAYMGKEYF